MEIFFYQGLIFSTLVLVRTLSPKYLEIACLAWTALTLLNLFWPPLIVLQLIVVWGTYALIRPKELAKATSEVNLNSSRPQAEQSEQIPQNLEEASPYIRFAALKVNIGSSAAMSTVEASEKIPKKGNHDPIGMGKVSSDISDSVPIDEPGLRSVGDEKYIAQQSIIKAKARPILIPTPAAQKSSPDTSSEPILNDSLKRAASISDAAIESRRFVGKPFSFAVTESTNAILNALRAAEERAAPEVAQSTSQEKLSDEKGKPRPAVTRLVSEDEAPMLVALKAKRHALAEEANVPPYVIFPDRTLLEIAEKRPSTMDQMSGITGLGAKKLERYGAEFLAVITGTMEQVDPQQVRLVGMVYDRLAETQRALLRGEGGTGKYLSVTHSTLRLIAEQKPSTLSELQNIHGMGEQKVERFGDAFLQVLSDVEAGRDMHHEVNVLATQNIQGLQAEIERLGIPHLVHFTRCDNLKSILTHGLLCVSDCRAQGIDAARNDMVRLDGKPDGTSLSVAFPNYKMFYKYRQSEPAADWAVLILQNRVLLEKDCGFFKYNAADNRMRGLPREQTTTVLALKEMFENYATPREEWLRPYDPTDPQAEIMVYEAIEPDMIEAVAFETKDIAQKWAAILGGIETIYAGKGKGLFGSRKQTRGN